MKELEELFDSWIYRRRQNPELILTEARRIISLSKSDGWRWVSDSLKDERKNGLSPVYSERCQYQDSCSGRCYTCL